MRYQVLYLHFFNLVPLLVLDSNLLLVVMAEEGHQQLLLQELLLTGLSCIIVHNIHTHNNTNTHTHTHSCENEVGRPRIEVSKEDILELRLLKFSWTKISRILRISRQTLYRCLEEYEIPCNDYADISPTELDEVVLGIKQDHPNHGEVMVMGHLARLGVKVPRSQVRSCIHRVDHANVEQRRRHVVKRRQVNQVEICGARCY